MDIFDPDRETLADNLEVVKESLVLFGTLQTGDATPSVPMYNSFPPSTPRTRQNFLALNDPYDTALFNTESDDADMTCHLTLPPADLPASLYVGMSPQHQQEVQEKIGGIRPEMVMFAGTEDVDASVLLPGWGQQDGDSILVNGRPLNGVCEISSNQAAISLGNSIVPFVGQSVRVTGAMVFDIGHGNRPLEIHPVYAMDYITATPRDDWSGVWGDTLGVTHTGRVPMKAP